MPLEVSVSMTAPLPIDPLDEPLHEFVEAVKYFLTFNVDPLEQPTFNPADDIRRKWEEAKRHLTEFHGVVVNAEPEIDRRHRLIAETGRAVLPLTNDRQIDGPVRDLMKMASADRADLRILKRRIGKAGSVFGFSALVVATVQIGPRMVQRRQQMIVKLDELTTYYLWQMPPREPGS